MGRPIDAGRLGTHTRSVSALGESWQWILVAVLELAAIVYLGRRLFGRVTPTARRGPDVPVSALIRKRK